MQPSLILCEHFTTGNLLLGCNGLPIRVFRVLPLPANFDRKKGMKTVSKKNFTLKIVISDLDLGSIQSFSEKKNFEVTLIRNLANVFSNTCVCYSES